MTDHTTTPLHTNTNTYATHKNRTSRPARRTRCWRSRRRTRTGSSPSTTRSAVQSSTCAVYVCMCMYMGTRRADYSTLPPPPSHPAHNPDIRHTKQVDDANTISPTLSLKKGYLTYTWTHLLGDGAKLETTLDPFNVRRPSPSISIPAAQRRHCVSPWYPWNVDQPTDQHNTNQHNTKRNRTST